MEGLKLGLETAVVGLFALSWIFVLVELIAPGRIRDGLHRMSGHPNWATPLAFAAAAVIYVVGSIVAPVADGVFDSDSWRDLPGVRSDSEVRADVYGEVFCREGTLDRKLVQVLTSVGSCGLPALCGNRRLTSEMPPCTVVSGSKIDKTRRDAARDIYQYQKFRAYDDAERAAVLKPMKDQIVVLRGVAFSAGVASMLSFLMLSVLASAPLSPRNAHLRRGDWAWPRIAVAWLGLTLLPMPGLALILFAAGDDDQRLWPLYVLGAALLAVSAFAAQRMRARRPSLVPWWRVALVSALIAVLAQWGWEISEDEYDTHVIRLYRAAEGPPVLNTAGTSSRSRESSAAAPSISTPIAYSGVCDASAAVISGDEVLVINDEDAEETQLRFYDLAGGGPPKRSVTLRTEKLQFDTAEPELDLEGAARIREQLFLIGSHSPSRKGEFRQSRHNLFAVPWPIGARAAHVEPVARSYDRLLRDIDRKFDFGLGNVSIEGLAGRPDGTVAVGFRSITAQGSRARAIDGRAVIITLKPEFRDGRMSAKLREHALLDVGGHGIRSLHWDDARGRYLVLTGPEARSQFAIYSWRGGRDSPVLLMSSDAVNLHLDGEAHAEALDIEEKTGDVFVFFDEGDRKVDGKDCKSAGESRRGFHGVRIQGM